jgi:hypothetical protein
VKLPGLVSVLTVPVLSGNRFHEKVAALPEISPQRFLIDRMTHRLEGLGPRLDVLTGVVDQGAVDVEQEDRGHHKSSLESAVMAREQPNPSADKAQADDTAVKPHHENPIHRLAEEVEAHLIEGAELATSTTSAETNVVLAALGAIEGPQVPKPKAEKKRDGGKKRKPRPKAR